MSVENLNKWQKYYCDKWHKGKMPKSKSGKEDLELLAQVKESVTVELPTGTKTLIVTEEDCDIPNGKISIDVLLSNLKLWLSRGHKITTK